MDALVVGVEGQCGGVAFSQCERGCRLGRVVEAVNLAEGGVVAHLGEVPQDAAGLDGAELTVIPDEPDTGTLADGVLDARGEFRRGRHAGLVDEQQRALADSRHPGGGFGGDRDGVDELAQCVAHYGLTTRVRTVAAGLDGGEGVAELLRGDR